MKIKFKGQSSPYQLADVHFPKMRTTYYIMTLFSNYFLVVIIFELSRNYNFVFADDAQGTNLSSNPDGKSFIGFASGKTSPTPSLNPVDYVWVHLGGGSGSLSLETEARIINNGDNTYQIVSTYSDITIYDTNKGSIPTIDIVDNILTVNNSDSCVLFSTVINC